MRIMLRSVEIFVKNEHFSDLDHNILAKMGLYEDTLTLLVNSLTRKPVIPRLTLALVKKFYFCDFVNFELSAIVTDSKIRASVLQTIPGLNHRN